MGGGCDTNYVLYDDLHPVVTIRQSDLCSRLSVYESRG